MNIGNRSAQRAMSSTEKRLPLSDVVVVDFTHVIAGPFAAMALADLGATVLKIETPGRGETARFTPPHQEGMSHFFAAVNRNKYSVALNLKDPKGKELLDNLIKKSHVVIHNFRPGVMEKLRLGYEDLTKLRADLIYCAISGFGQDSPLRDRPAFDGVIQAMAGLMSLTGEAGGSPVRAGLSVGDYIPGLYAALAITVAIRDRDRTGRGQFIDVSNFDCLFNLMGYYIPYFQLTNKVPVRTGGAHPTVVPMGAFPTADSHIVVAAFDQNFWRNLCRALDKKEWLDDPRFVTLTSRAKHSAVLFDELCNALRKRTTGEWEKILTDNDVPCGPILDVGQLVDHPQVVHRRLIGDVNEHGLRVPMRPVKYQSFDQEVRLAPPRLGEDTIAILHQFNCIDEEVTADELRAWVENGVIDDPTMGVTRATSS